LEEDVRARLKAAVSVLASSVLALGLAEGTLRLRERVRAPAAKGGLDYGDALRADGLGPGGFLKEGFEGRVVNGLGGTAFWRNNAQGFRRTEDTPETPLPGVVRVLSMGDSFTAGYRVDQEETFSRLLEKDLAAHGPAEVLISEIEEPVTGLFWLDRSGARFHPSAVILGLTLGNDVAQAGLALDPPGAYRIEPPAFRIGRVAEGLALESRDEILAAIPEACLAGAPAEAPVRWRLHVLDLAFGMPVQPIGSSRGPGLSRFLLDGVNGLGICLVPPPPLVDVLFERLSRTLLGYRALAKERGFVFAVVLFPQRYAVQEEDWNATVAAYGLRPACFDPGAPARRLHAFCAQEGITCFDPAAALAAARRRSGRSQYLPGGDMHWNADGHRAVFEALRERVRALVYGKIPSSR
jgi:lysophospholipase L1-like esterase